MLPPDLMGLRLRQLHASLDAAESEETVEAALNSGRHEVKHGRYWFTLDFTDGMTEEQMLNVLESLVNNVACLKDHFDQWLINRQRFRQGDGIINSTFETKIVHDLWNAQKHGSLNRPPRSGIMPRLVNVTRWMRMRTGPGGTAFVSIEPGQNAGKPTLHQSGESRVTMQVDADIIDERGRRVGGLMQTCAAAVGRWEEALTAAGVPVPPR